MDLYKLPAHQLHQMLVTGEVSAVNICEDVFSRIRDVEEQVRAYVTLTEDIAFRNAEEVDKKIARGEKIPPLAGIPVAIKDNMCIKGIKTTCSSKILENYYPVYTSTAAQRALDQLIVLTGKTNLDEFAMGSSTENSAFHVTNNPWRAGTVPGGSSGGSAAAVAAGEAVMALGSDTGGSIRQPASLCGVVGFKPTYGLVSRYGLVAFASSLDQIGPITKDVADCALLLNCICGHDRKDSTSIEAGAQDYTKALTKNIEGLRMGILTEFMSEGVEPEVRTAVEDACKLMQELGAIVEETSLPHADYALSAYYIIAPAEASSNLARFDGVRYGYRTEQAENILEMYMKTRAEGFGDEVKRRIMLGTYALSAGYYAAYYGQAQKIRTLILEDFKKAFEHFDVLLAPTSPTVAFAIGEKAADPLQMYLSDVCTIPVNLAGIPGISVPCGLAQGLPIGLQIMGKAFDEETILKVAYAFEQNYGFKEEPDL
jgi:aspartyl-tRNA(Asn)/glutamyl-tRNA(Gln) amidotransferase subunit A